MNQPTTEPRTIEVVFCMGSSCFSRGGNRGLALLQAYLKEKGLEKRVHVCGRLCQGRCQDGPNLTIDGRSYHAVAPGVVPDLVRHHLETGPENA